MMDASEREQALRAMRASADAFYRSAVQIGVHPFMGFQAGTAENSVVCDREPPAGRLTTDATVESLAAV